MDFEKDEFEEELENENAGFFEFQLQKEEDIIDQSRIKRLRKRDLHVKYDLKVDLNKKIIRFFVNLPHIILEDVTENEKVRGFIKKEVIKYTSILAFKKTYILRDNIVFIDNKPYIIPDFFNYELIAKNDLDTWERIFYCFLSDEIRLELASYDIEKGERQ